MMFRPLFPYFSWNSMNHGISILHGPHHVAQKSSSTTLPLNAESFTSLLFRSLKVKFMFAGLAFAGQAGPAASALPSGHGAGTVTKASARAPNAAIAHRRFIAIFSSRSFQLAALGFRLGVVS